MIITLVLLVLLVLLVGVVLFLFCGLAVNCCGGFPLHKSKVN